MHARELIQLAALVSAYGPLMIRGGGSISEAGMERYWTASKCRLDRWGRALKAASNAAADAPASSDLCGLIEEILTGEALTRVWTAVACAYDRHHAAQQMEPIARSVLIGHMEARHRVLMLLVRQPGMSTEEAVMLNRLRRRVERWTDMLIGYLVGIHDVSEFAVDPERAKNFAEDLRYQQKMPGGNIAWSLIRTSLQAGFARPIVAVSPNQDLNRKIAVSLLACFRSELFDGTGLFRSAWLERLSNVTDDAQGMIDELLETGGRRVAPPAEPLADRWKGLGG